MDIKVYEEQVHRIKLGKNPLTESAFQKLIIDHLVNDNGYQLRKASSYDPVRAMDVDLLFGFLKRTQTEQMERLHALYNGGRARRFLPRSETLSPTAAWWIASGTACSSMQA